MKKITALILMVALLVVCVAPAFADRPVPDDDYVPKREWRLSHGKGAYYLSQTSTEEYSDSWEGGGYKETDTDTYDATFAGNELKQLVRTIKYKGVEQYDDSEHEFSGTTKYTMTGNGTILKAEYENADGYYESYEFDGTTWHDKDGNKLDEEVVTWLKSFGKVLIEEYEPEFKWYKNTVCLMGLPIRDLKPGLTDKWYTVVPVDLTKDATYTYPMIAGSIYYLGECQVTVKDGQVTTDFSLPEGLCWDEKHCLQWFTSLDDITTDFLNDPKGSFTFGQPVSISGDLKGQDVALLFICNQAEYRIPLLYTNKCFLTRYYSTQDHVKAAQADMTALLDKIR